MLLLLILCKCLHSSKREPFFLRFFPQCCTIVADCVTPCAVTISPLFRRVTPSRWQQHSSAPETRPPCAGLRLLLPGVPRASLQHPPGIVPTAALRGSHIAASPRVSCLEQLIFAFVGFELRQFPTFVFAYWLSVANTCSQPCDTFYVSRGGVQLT